MPAPLDTSVYPPLRHPSAAPVYEQTHVHAVYETIAPHFSATRHKPWPLVAWFLHSRKPGALGFDIGCGNGKYLAVNGGVVLVGCDRSWGLVGLARERMGKMGRVVGKEDGTEKETVAAGADVVVADSLALPFRQDSADFAISIAVVHHFSTIDRRRDAVREILDVLRDPVSARHGGQQEDKYLVDSAGLQIPEGAEVNERAEPGVCAGEALIYVWALEQRGSRRGWDEGMAQDQLVPWVTKGRFEKKKKKQQQLKNWKGRGEEQEDETKEIKEEEKMEGERGKGEETKDRTVYRYYHLYRKGELERDVRAVGGVVVRSGYEKDNWWVICRRCPSFTP